MAASEVTVSRPEIAGFLRRAVALFVDYLVVAIPISILFLIGVMQSHGQLRLSSSPFRLSECHTMPVSAARVISLPANFRVDDVKLCTQSSFGIVFDRQLRVSEITKSGSLTSSRVYTTQVDAEGKAIQTRTLDNDLNLAVLVLLAVYLCVSEWHYGASLGKRLMGTRVRSATGGQIRFGQSAMRTLIRAVPFLFVVGLGFVPEAVGKWILEAFLLHPFLIIGICYSPVIALIANMLVTTTRALSPWYDRKAGTVLLKTTSDIAAPQVTRSDGAPA